MFLWYVGGSGTASECGGKIKVHENAARSRQWRSPEHLDHDGRSRSMGSGTPGTAGRTTGSAGPLVPKRASSSPGGSEVHNGHHSHVGDHVAMAHWSRRSLASCGRGFCSRLAEPAKPPVTRGRSRPRGLLRPFMSTKPCPTKPKVDWSPRRRTSNRCSRSPALQRTRKPGLVCASVGDTDVDRSEAASVRHTDGFRRPRADGISRPSTAARAPAGFPFNVV